jgi:Ankyrin repeats (3 copies)
MFAWASSHIEKLSQTVAPPPTDGVGRFVHCCQKGDEDGALGAISEIPGAGVIVNSAKGQVALHVACIAGMIRVVRALLSQPGATLDTLDSAGNTPLHCAAMSTNPSSALELVKVLVTEFQASVVTKNTAGQTPYDVASLNSIRQYLLPLQLQQETQYALDNGGVGLPPGIDLGGLRISRYVFCYRYFGVKANFLKMMRNVFDCPANCLTCFIQKYSPATNRDDSSFECTTHVRRTLCGGAVYIGI